jgi:serine/threonine-protein kinase HipA
MIKSLSVFLNDNLVGSLNLLPGEQSLFIFADDYLNNSNRPTLSQSFLSNNGDLILESRPTRSKLPPWFSNLLPEGQLRNYLASLGGINPAREFQLLELLGDDLPGAVRVVAGGEQQAIPKFPLEKLEIPSNQPLRFSLAGVQLKFSAFMEKQGGLTIPATGIGGDWIVKLPSPIYPAVPENEAAMLMLAKKSGIQVPEFRLVPIETIQGLPEFGPFLGSKALAVKRFDRDRGKRIHMEDLAQVFGIFPENKYEKVGFVKIATMINLIMGPKAAQDFVARLAFTIITGNGDMHLKNWSLLYPNGITPVLSPAYDLVSTVPYIPNDRLALNFVRTKKFPDITKELFRKFSVKALLPQAETLQTVERIVDAVKQYWPGIRKEIAIPNHISDKIDAHIHATLIVKDM